MYEYVNQRSKRYKRRLRRLSENVRFWHRAKKRTVISEGVVLNVVT